jgi:hypothetical protein
MYPSSCPQFNKSSAFKKLGKLTVAIVPHNIGKRCIIARYWKRDIIPPPFFAPTALISHAVSDAVYSFN